MRGGVLTTLLLLPAVALATPAVTRSADAEAYCAFVGNANRSETSPLMSPQFFLNYGVVNGDDATTGAGGIVSLPPTTRLTVGLRYSITGLAQGIMSRQRATAECLRYTAESDLHRFMQAHREVATVGAVRAQSAILQAALPHANQILNLVRNHVEKARATVQELHATQLRVDALSDLAAEVEGRLAGLAETAPSAPPAQLIQRREQAEEKVERMDARLRALSAWDLNVRGGYDRFYGFRDELPLFIVVSLTVNPAAIAQPFYDARAREARLKWVRAQEEGIGQRVENLTRRLSTVHRAEQRRLRETTVLLADLESRLKSVDAIDNDKLRRYREALWFDWVKLKADHEYLRVHVADLSASLGGTER
jgi:hypothetical protein